MKCTAHTAAGNACKLDAIRGALVCHKHGGSAPHVKANAAVRAEVMHWGLDSPTVDPGETLLKLVSQSAARVQRISTEIEQLVNDSPSLHEALVAETWIPTENAGSYKAGEYIRGLAVLEAQERDRCATFCAKAIAAGLAERQVRLAEKQGALLADFLRGVLADPALGLTDEQRRAIPDVAERHLALVS
jgi:hypothetical protein